MGNSASSLPYTIGKQVSLVNDGWALHEGARKSDNEVVSVFFAKKPTLLKTPLNRKEPNITQFVAAKHHYVHCKKLRHPNILKVYATLDTDNPNDTAPTGIGSSNATTAATTTAETGDLIIVTEPCIPLDEWITKYQPTVEQMAWGLESIVKALHFLHTSANQCHGNLSSTSFYVTQAGDVKLWNFSLVTSVVQNTPMSRHFIDYENLITPDIYRSNERKEGRWDAIIAAGPHVMDSYGLGMLIGHLFHGQIPQLLMKAVQRLQTDNLKMRPKLLPLLKCPMFDTPYQKLQLSLEEIQVQPVEQKIAFWNTIITNLQGQFIPELLAVYKLLPLIKQTIITVCNNESMKVQDMYRREVLSTLPSLFYIAETYLNKDDCAKLGHIFKTLFNVNDRAIRGALLQKAPFLEQNLDKDTLNTAVFEPTCSGFSDSSAALRELTLKATLVLVPHLTHPNLEKLARYLVRLQADQEASIRTNTVIFFSKLAPYLTETTRQKMLLPAFVRAMKDPFTPCRNAALKSALKAKEFFNPEGIASQVLPAITPRLLDPSPDVRREAFAAVDELLFVLRQESERLNTLPQQQQQPGAAAAAGSAPVPAQQQQQQQQKQQPPPVASSSGGWGISSWIGKSSHEPAAAAAAAAPPQPTVSAAAQQRSGMPPMITTGAAAAPYHQPVGGTAMMTSNMGSLGINSAMNNNSTGILDDSWGEGEDGSGWDDDDLLDLNATKVALPAGAMVNGQTSTTAANSSVKNLFSTAAGGGDDDEFFDAFEAKPAKAVIPRVPAKGSSGKLAIPGAKKTTPATKLAVAKPAITKLSSDEGPDGWDDF